MSGLFKKDPYLDGKPGPTDHVPDDGDEDRFIKWVNRAFIFLLVVVPASLYILHVRSDKDWDRKVKQLCAQDGGLKVLEKVSISEALYRELGGSNGELPFPPASSEPASTPFYAEEIKTSLFDNRAGRDIERTETRFMQRDGNKTLAVNVNYRLRGAYARYGRPPAFGTCRQPRDGLTRQFVLVEGGAE